MQMQQGKARRPFHVQKALFIAAAVALSGASRSLANVDDTWTGAVDTNWNTPGNWSLGALPDHNANPQQDAVINITSPTATITQDFNTVPTDIFVGRGTGNTGLINQSAGTASSGPGNWMFIGTDGGTGTWNLADTTTTGGTLTGYGQGSGNITDTGRIYIGGRQAGATGGTGTFNVNTSGTVNIGVDLALGTAGSLGVMNVDAGTINTGTAGGWNFVGKDENGSGGQGILNMSGGTFNNQTGRTYVGFGNTVGQINLSGNSSYTNTADFFSIGAANGNNVATIKGSNVSSVNLSGNATLNTASLYIGGDQNNGDYGKGTLNVTGAGAAITANGELWVSNGTNGTNGSVGTLNVSAGTVTSNNWFVIGRQGGTGTLNISGTGFVQKTNAAAGHFDVGANPNATGTVNLNGGTLQVPDVFQEGGNSTFNFNGGTLQANQSSASFMQNLTQAYVKAGGAVIDSNGNNITIAQPLLASPTSAGGGLQKIGSGTLTLTGSNTYTGGTTILGDTLVAGADHALGTGNVTVTGGTTLTDTGGILNDYIGDTATLNVQTGGTFDLNYTGTDIIGGLIVDGTKLGPGVYGSTAGPGVTPEPGFNGTGTVTVAAATPEPASLTLLGLGAIGLLARRRRARGQSA